MFISEPCYKTDDSEIKRDEELVKKLCEIRIKLTRSKGSKMNRIIPDVHVYPVPFSSNPQENVDGTARNTVPFGYEKEFNPKDLKKKPVSFATGVSQSSGVSHCVQGRTEVMAFPDAFTKSIFDTLEGTSGPPIWNPEESVEKSWENIEDDNSGLLVIAPQNEEDTIVTDSTTNLDAPNPVLIIPQKTKNRTKPSDPYATTLPKGKNVSEYMYMCPVCNKEFGSKIMLEVHARRCWGNITAPPNLRTKKILSKSSTNKKTYNPEHDPYHVRCVCNLCNKQFVSKQWLALHQKNEHGIVRKYRCKRCLKSYNTNQQLLNHQCRQHGPYN